MRVNCLAAHTILTQQIQRVAPEEWREKMAAAIPLGRLGTPEDVALAAVSYLVMPGGLTPGLTSALWSSRFSKTIERRR